MTRILLAAGLLAISVSVLAETTPVANSSAPSATTSTDPTTSTASPSTSSAANSFTGYSSSNSVNSSLLPEAPQQSYNSNGAGTNGTDGKHNQPVATIPFGFSYTLVDVNDTNGSPDTSFLGWYFAPTVQVTRHIAARFDLEQDYDAHRNLSNLHYLRATAGPEFTFPIPLLSKWTSPFVYVEGGDTRIRFPGYIQWEATAVGGFGLQVPITRRIGFQVIPGEYSTIKLDNGNWQGDYSAKAGFVLNLYGDR